MFEIGQEVVLMSAPGRFRVVEVDGPYVTIENDLGLRKKVLDRALRTLPPRSGDDKAA